MSTPYEPGYEPQTVDMEKLSPQMLEFLRRQGVPVPQPAVQEESNG